MVRTEKKQKYWLMVYGIVAVFAYFSKDESVKMACYAFIFYSAAFLRYINPYLLYLAVSISLYSLGNPVSSLIATLPVYFNRNLLKMRLGNAQVTGLLALLLFSIISYRNGIDSTLSTMLVYYSCVLVFIQMLQKEFTLKEFYMYVLLLFFVIAAIETGELLSGTITIRFGRLALYDNIRRLANAIAIPTFASFAMLSQPRDLFAKRNLYLIVGGISSFILFLTLSKGALIATVAGLVVVFYLPIGRRTRHLSTYLFPIIIIALIYFVVQYAENNFDMFHFDRLLDEDEGFSGRTGIWEEYYEYMKRDTSLLIFGLGPGDLKRLSVNGFYAHSQFLDVFFSYGVMMSVLWLIVLINIFLKILRSRSAIAMGIFVFTSLLYATHGNVTNIALYILYVIAYHLATDNTKGRSRITPA